LLSAGMLSMLNAQTAATTNVVRCSSYEYEQRELATDPNYQANRDVLDAFTANYVANHPNGVQDRSIVYIPVIFHVLYHTASQNLSLARLQEQIDVLNKDYSGTNVEFPNIPAGFAPVAAHCDIQFCMAKRDPSGNWTDGVERVSTANTSFDDVSDNAKHASSGGADAWDRNQYLNLWVCNLSGGLLGYSTPPGGSAALDGCVLLYSAVGVTGAVSPYNKGRTATHEIGHWLNLRHVWGDDGSSCAGSDGVADTPNQSSENYGCPTYPHTDACSPNSPGVMFMNYMDYTDDACMYMFSEGQKTRMWACLNSSRILIQSSTTCQVTGVAEAILQGAFNVMPSPSADGKFTVHFGSDLKDVDINVYNVVGQMIYHQHADAITESDMELDLSANDPGVYFFELKSGNDRAIKKIMIQ
ncbi:MAG TPA: M43 family zinc metalloprotease, partial [Bacteroidia bacterium]|nr:M43 family zinc metalloprotease [Bacteroidia bacterium]